MPTAEDIQGAAADAMAQMARRAVTPAISAPPEDQPQQQQTVSEQDIQAAAAAALQRDRPQEAPRQTIQEPGGIESTIAQGIIFPAKRLAEDIVGIPAAAATDVAGLMGLQEAPNLQGKSIPEVQATKAQMQKDLVTQNQILDNLMKSPSPDDTALYLASQRVNSLEARIGQADDIVATHRPLATQSPMAQPVGQALRNFAAQAQPTTKQWLDEAFPTTQHYANSLFGQMEMYGADAVVLGAAHAALGPIGTAAAGSTLFTTGAYSEAKANGADDETAERAGLITGVVSSAAMGVIGPTINGLAKSFAGLSAKQGINAIVATMGTGAIRVAGGQAEMLAVGTTNNAIAKLTGYDPNRKLGASFWQNFWLGTVFGSIHALTETDPELSQLNNANKPKVRSQGAVAEMPGERGFVLPTAGAPPTPTGQLRPTTPVVPTVLDTRSNEQKWTDFVDQQTKEPTKEAPLQLGPGEQQPSFQLGGKTPEQAAQTLSLGPPSTQTLETQGERPAEAARAAEQPAPTAPVAATEAVHPLLQNDPVARKSYDAIAEPYDKFRYLHHLWSISGGDPNRGPEPQPPTGAKVTPAPPTPQPDLSAYARPRLQKLLDKLNNESSAITDEFIAQGRGTERPSEIRTKTDPLSLRYIQNADALAHAMHEKEYRETYHGSMLPVKRPESTTPDVPAWYEGDQFASRRPQTAAELPPDRAVTPDDVKAETQAAQEKMGMHDNLVYTPTVDALPQHVREGMTPQEMNTAQVVTDRKLGNVHIIGDRFSTLNELRRAIIEETIPYRYRNVSQVYMTHNPYSNDLANYDHIGDRPILNTHALLRSGDPYQDALKSAMEEVNVHQGISRLLGPREGIRYVRAMGDIQSQFNRLQLNDILAQQKGYKNADEMAAAYNAPNWRTDPRQANKMTEELVGAYANTFKTPEELTANAPSWYQLALRNMGTGIRRFLGLRVDPYDVQGLINDSAAALRAPKWAQPSRYHPIGDAAKAEMQMFQFANRPPPVVGEEGAAGAAEKVNIGDLLVAQRLAQLREEVAAQPGKQLRTQAVKFAQDQRRTLQEKLNLLRDWPAIISHEGWDEQMKMALSVYNEDMGGDPNRALDYIINTKIDGAQNPIFTELATRKARDQIKALNDAGQTDQANLLAARMDRANQISLADPTEAGRELAAQRMRSMNGSNQVARHRIITDNIQEKAVAKRPKVKDAINNGKDAIDQVTKDAANTLGGRVANDLNNIAQQHATRSPSTLYTIQGVVDRITDAMFKTNTGFTEEDRPIIDRVLNNFRQTIQDVIKERTPPVEGEQQARPAAIDRLRDVLQYYPGYKEAWGRTMDNLIAENADLAQRFDRAIDEPIGEKLANNLASEAGTNLKDLVVNHFATNDRLNTDLATKIIRQTGIDGDLATQMADHLQGLFGDIIRKEQRNRLQSIINSVGGTNEPARGELNRLVDHIVLGGLDNAEWRNLVAPRFGIAHITPEQIDALRKAGDYMAYLRDISMADTHIAQGVRQQIGDIMRLTRPELGGNTLMDQIRYISDVYAASLLTGPLTHAPYWQQAVMTGMFNNMVQTARVMAGTKGEMNEQILHGLGARLLDNYARGISEFGPILRSGIKAHEEFMSRRGGQVLRSGSLEQVESTLRDPGSWFALYKYPRNFIEAMSNLMTRGSQEATARALMTKLVWEDGLRGQDAAEAVERTVLGTPEQQQAAVDESHRVVEHLTTMFPDFPINEDYRKMLEGELLDRYKTTALKADGTVDEARTQDLRDIHRRAMAPAMRGVLRGDVPGMWGKVSRGMLDFANDYPGLRMIAPFLKVPFNLVNEHLAWTPLGIWRSAADLVPTEGALGRLISNTPGLRGGIESYIGEIPGMKQRIASGEISQDQIRDYAWEQMTKGVIGSAGAGALYMVVRSMLGNPNAPLRFTYTGPSNYGQQEIERGKGWQPNSVYFGGAWHSYENTPFRALFAGLGAMSDYFHYEKQDPDAGMNEVSAAYRMMSGGASSVFGSPLQGPEAILQMLTGMAGSEGVQRNAVNFASQATAALLAVPFGGTFTRQMLRLYDPTQYEANTPWGKFLRYVPVVNGMFGEPKLNVFGEHMYSSPLHNIPEYTPSGGILGIGKSVDPNDPVWNYLAEHPGLHLSMPGNNASVARIKMTPEEIYAYHLARGPALKQRLEQIIGDPHFAELTEARQNYLIKHVYEHEANLIGAAAVMRYRQQHPVDPERRAAMLRGKGVEPPAVETTAQPLQTE